jgi:hypothetical protein
MAATRGCSRFWKLTSCQRWRGRNEEGRFSFFHRGKGNKAEGWLIYLDKALLSHGSRIIGKKQLSIYRLSVLFPTGPR